MKTYILKRSVYNNVDFPIGTIVTITDDYWGNGNNNKNTGFTVAEGELKGEKGCVADGLDGWLVDDIEENRTLIQRYIEQEENLEKQLDQNAERIENIPNCALVG